MAGEDWSAEIVSVSGRLRARERENRSRAEGGRSFAVVSAWLGRSRAGASTNLDSIRRGYTGSQVVVGGE